MSTNPNSKKHFLLLLILANDVNLNPGPSPNHSNSTITDTCMYCHLETKLEDDALECEECFQWVHKNCIGMSDNIFNCHAQHLSYIWICCTCGLPNFSNSLFSITDLDISNSFDVLSSHDETDNTSQYMPPLMSSSPHGPTLNKCKRKTSASTNRSHKQYNRRHKQTSKCPTPKSLKFLNLNCQSVRAKLPNFLSLIDSEKPDIIIGTESWLNKNITNGEIFPDDYQAFRRYRVHDTHGGVFIATSNTLIATERPDLATDCEIIWVTIQLKGLKPLYIGAFYRPPSTDSTYITELQKSLGKKPAHAHVWLLGDFNLPDINWDTNCFKSGGRHAHTSKLLLDISQEFNLHQVVTEPTRDNNILDLAFTSNTSLVNSVQVKAGISDHDIVIIHDHLRPIKFKPKPRKIYLYKKGNMNLISDDLISLNDKLTTEVINDSNIDDLWGMFKSTLLDSMDRNIPSKMSSPRFSLPWVNHKIRRQIRMKQKIYNKARASGNYHDNDSFKKFRRQIDRNIRKEYRRHVKEDICGSLESNNTKSFWKFIKSKRQQTFGTAPLTGKDGKLAQSASEKAAVLNNQFTSVFTVEDTSNLPLLDKSDTPQYYSQY
ncbi:uncharacterized protein LOC144450581 [Glandiceps talaboti]